MLGSPFVHTEMCGLPIITHANIGIQPTILCILLELVYMCMYLIIRRSMGKLAREGEREREREGNLQSNKEVKLVILIER